MTVQHLIPVDSIKTTPPDITELPQVEIGRLVPGCYVKIRLTDYDFWAEVQSVQDRQLNALVRSVVDEQSVNFADAAQWLGRTVSLTAADIQDTGCDHLCWC